MCPLYKATPTILMHRLPSPSLPPNPPILMGAAGYIQLAVLLYYFSHVQSSFQDPSSHQFILIPSGFLNTCVYQISDCGLNGLIHQPIVIAYPSFAYFKFDLATHKTEGDRYMRISFWRPTTVTCYPRNPSTSYRRCLRVTVKRSGIGQ